MSYRMFQKPSEAGFQQAVIEYAQLRGWKVLHIRKARRKKDGAWVTPVAADGKGWVDLFMVRGDRLVAAELKFGKNTLTQEQADWLNVLHETGKVEAYNWYPEDWPTIEEVLS